MSACGLRPPPGSPLPGKKSIRIIFQKIRRIHLAFWISSTYFKSAHQFKKKISPWRPCNLFVTLLLLKENQDLATIKQRKSKQATNPVSDRPPDGMLQNPFSLAVAEVAA
jgi:hypothetical protein